MLVYTPFALCFVTKNGSFLEKEFLSKEVSGRKVELDEVIEPSLELESSTTPEVVPAPLIRPKRIYNFLCSMLVYTPFALCFITLRAIFMHFTELTY
jgi:hypothetical protein